MVHAFYWAHETLAIDGEDCAARDELAAYEQLGESR
jgi:hypothetical protein